MEVKACLIDSKTGLGRPLRIVFDTGAYMTTIDSKTLLRAGYNISKGRDAELAVVGRSSVPAKEILVKGLDLVDINDQLFPLGPVLVYATDMSDTETVAVLGLNIIREFETRIRFGNKTIVELIPQYDMNQLTEYDNFLRAESRFGIWAPGQF